MSVILSQPLHNSQISICRSRIILWLQYNNAGSKDNCHTAACSRHVLHTQHIMRVAITPIGTRCHSVVHQRHLRSSQATTTLHNQQPHSAHSKPCVVQLSSPWVGAQTVAVIGIRPVTATSPDSCIVRRCSISSCARRLPVSQTHLRAQEFHSTPMTVKAQILVHVRWQDQVVSHRCHSFLM